MMRLIEIPDNGIVEFPVGTVGIQTVDLNKFPAVDAVQVVRCKDCEYCHEGHYEDSGEKPYIKLSCKYSPYSHQENDFCSYGERRNSDGEK